MCMWQLTSVFIRIEHFLALTLMHLAVQLSAKILLASHLKVPLKAKKTCKRKNTFENGEKKSCLLLHQTTPFSLALAKDD